MRMHVFMCVFISFCLYLYFFISVCSRAPHFTPDEGGQGAVIEMMRLVSAEHDPASHATIWSLGPGGGEEHDELSLQMVQSRSGLLFVVDLDQRVALWIT